MPLFRSGRQQGYKRPPEVPLSQRPISSDEQSNEALLASAQQGDREAYRLFLKRILPFARALAFRQGLPDDLVEDVVQDTLLTVHRVRHTYQPGRPVGPWIAAIVSRRAIDAKRKRGRTARRERPDTGASETFADPSANWMEKAEAADTLADMMKQLPPRQREALDLVKLKEMTLAEASEASGQTVGALKVNVHRAIQKIRQGLKENGTS